ncbi:MAG TPA: tetratricopeptide repeat protein [Polyangiaceae bacterium]|nr:tetratricopeptide repeat protein [Polyangiaceae bacterium]
MNPNRSLNSAPWLQLVEHLGIAALIGWAIISCSSANGAAGQDPERRSESEYDLARDAWLRRGNPREGLAHSLAALELDSDNADAHHLAALIYLDLCRRPGPEQCRLRDARQHAEAALALRKDYREARNTLGVILIHEKRPADAISVLLPLTTDILYTTPENAWGNLGWAHLELGNVDEAVTALERSVAAQPRFCVGYFRLGQARERKGMKESAIEAFTQALEADPRCRSLQDAYLARARLSAEFGRLEAARRDLDECVRSARESQTGKECDSLRQNLK